VEHYHAGAPMLLIVKKTKSKYNENADNWIFIQKPIREQTRKGWFLSKPKTSVKISFKKSLENS
jgi:hypothetical protein